MSSGGVGVVRQPNATGRVLDTEYMSLSRRVFRRRAGERGTTAVFLSSSVHRAIEIIYNSPEYFTSMLQSYIVNTVLLRTEKHGSRLLL